MDETSTLFIKDEAEFDSLLSSNKLVVIHCTAWWCGSCKFVTQLTELLAIEYEDRAKVYKLDVDVNKEVVKRFSVDRIPAVMFFLQGQLVETLIGVRSYEEFTTALEKALAE